MESQKVKITPPEGYEIDREKSTFEEIVFKQISKYPTTLRMIPRKYYLNNGLVREVRDEDALLQSGENFSSKERAEEVQALIQLLAFRDAVWEIDGWKPDWTDGCAKYVICMHENKIECSSGLAVGFILVFKTAETRDWFLKTHRELIEKAKNLL